ncbi:MAG: hypothetical protein ACOY0R_14710 [Chloroflexota bacterium]
MAKTSLPFPKSLALLAGVIVIALFAFLVPGPNQEANAAAGNQAAETCKTCHKAMYELWSISKHGSVPIDCETCHRLEGAGSHPEAAYSTPNQALTCDTCHADKAEAWKASRHGEIDLGCASCHEVHSQKMKVLDDNQLICANCHKEQFEVAHDSTHGAAGLSCENCHLGEFSDHSFKANITSCQACHADLHEADSLIAAGVKVEPVVPADPAAAPEATVEPVPAEAEAEPASDGGVHLPSWLLLAAGLLLGGVLSWVIFGRDPGTPTPEN